MELISVLAIASRSGSGGRVSARVLTSCVLVLLSSLAGCADDVDGWLDDQEHGGARSSSSSPASDRRGREGEGDGAPGDHAAKVVTLTARQARSARIETQAAGPAAVAQVLELRAVVAPDQDAHVHANAQVAGLVRAIHKGLGERVEEGEVLCVLDSVELGQDASEYLQAKTLLAAQRELLEREREILGRSVDLARMIVSRERELQERRISTIRTLYEAEQRLAEAELARDRRLLELEATLRSLEVQATVAHERLLVLGLGPDEVEGLSGRQGAGIGRYELRAPATGVIVGRHISLNEFVEPEDTLFQLQDLSRVWVEGRVYEKDLRAVQVGQRVRVALEAYPGVVLEGAVSLIGPTVDPTTRAATVRIVLENAVPGVPQPFPLRPGMFAKVEVAIGERVADVVIPEAAVVHEGDETFVFVKTGPTTYRRQAVQVEEAARGVVAVVAGLPVGAEVAVTGTFTLKSMARAEELGGGQTTP